MPKRKGTDRAWSEALAPTPKAKPEAQETGDKAPLYAELDRNRIEDLRDLARQLSRERGKRVPLAELVSEAIGDLLAKYQSR